MAPCVLEGPLLCVAHPVFDLGKGLFDRIEVGRVWRQEPEPGSGGFEDVTDGLGLVRAEIVHDDDVARPQDRNELLLDISAKALAVDRSVEDARSRELVTAQRTEEGQRTPVALGSEGAQTLAPLSPAAQRRHVGLDPGLIDEDEPSGIETGLPCPPAPTPAGDDRAGLLKSEQRFF